jgi:FG-GAP-like repeat
MPDLNADISLFNLNNRGATASLQTARNTYNQLLTDMNWDSRFISSSLILSQTITPLKSTAQNIDEAIVMRAAYTAAQPADQLAYTTQDGTARATNHLWITDGKANGTIELSATLANNNPNQQIFDIIDTHDEPNTYTSSVYFTRERSSSSGLAQPHLLELWRSSGTTTSTELIQSWNQISSANSSRTAAVGAAQAMVEKIKGIIYQPFQTDHPFTQAYNSRQIESSSNYHSHNSIYTLAGGRLLADGRLSSDFGSDRLANLGSISLSFSDKSIPVGQSREFFVRNDHEVWLNLNSTAERVATLDGTVQAAYNLDNRLVVFTDRGFTAIEVNMDVDPITSLLSGNYRALRNLARAIGGEAFAKEVVIPEVDTTGWSIKGIRDYDGDGDVDIFWRNDLSGQGVFWQMNGLKFEQGVVVGPQANYRDWTVNGFGDFDRDGDQDIFWHNNESGLNVLWEMQGLNYKSGTILPSTERHDWFFSGIGNFNGDRNLEMLWRNRDGTLVTWEIEGFKLKSGKVLSINVGSNDTIGWYVQAVTDFDNDGDSDILWRNSKSEAMVLWEMQSGEFKSGASLPSSRSVGQMDERGGSGYNFDFEQQRYGGQLDIDGDGKLDIWWQSPFTARREAWTFKRNSQNTLNYAGTLTK